MAVSDVLIVDNSGGHTAEAVAALHVVEEGGLELLGVTLDNAVGVLAEDLHLALVALAHAVALEPVLVQSLLLALWQHHRSFCRPLALIWFVIAFGVRNSFFPIEIVKTNQKFR